MIIQFFCRAVLLGVPLLYGSTGEILTEKSGHLNLGIPGIMYVGAISGVTGSLIYENSCGNDIANMNPLLAVLIPLLFSIIGSVLMGLIYSFLTVSLHANQNVTGLALTTFGIGLGNFLGSSLISITNSDLPSIALSNTSLFFSTKLPFYDKLGVVGELFFSYDFLTYFAIIIAVIVSIVLNRTRVGLNLRSVGESPATADAAGINVTRYKYLSTVIGSAIAGLGGLYFVMDYTGGAWTNGGFGDRGWLAIALVIFAIWNPRFGIIGSFLFGGLYILCVYIPGLSSSAKELINMLPYLVTIIVLVIISMRKKRENQPPAHLGLSYFREER